MQIEQILVATDLTRRSSVAYAHAAALARAYEARVILLHVDETDARLGGLIDDEALARYRQDLRAACEQQLEQEAASLGLPEGRVEIELVRGTPWRRTIATAERSGAELIVVTKPRGPVPAILGSTTKRVVRHADVPVLVVDPDGHAEAPNVADCRRVIYPTDFSDLAAIGLPVAGALASRLDADLVVTHVLPVVSPLPRLGHHAPSPELLELDLRQRATARLAELAARAGGPRSETLLLEGMNIAAALAGAADEETDLLVIPSHGRGVADAILLGSTAERLLRVTTRPVLILRRAYLEQLEA